MKCGILSLMAMMLVACPVRAEPVQASKKERSEAQKLGVCEKLGGVAVAAGTAAAAAKAAASAAGVAAVAHSSGTMLLTSVGVGGTGYIAGTLGGIGATALAALSSPVVIVVGAATAVAGGGAATYCLIKNRKRAQ